MGWTYLPPPPDKNTRQILEEELSGYNIIDFASPHPHVAFLAIRDSRDQVTAVVVLLDRKKSDPYNCTFGYKALHEQCGPFNYDCPERILAQLTDFEGQSEASREWRATCWAQVERRRNRAKLTVGDIVELAEPLTFRNGTTRHRLKVCDPKRRLFCEINDNPTTPKARYKLRNTDLDLLRLVSPEELNAEARQANAPQISQSNSSPITGREPGSVRHLPRPSDSA